MLVAVAADTAVLEDLFNNIIREMKLRPVGETQWHQFPVREGSPAFAFSRSRISLVTPFRARLALPQSFLLRARAAWDFETVLRQLFDAHSVSVRRLQRPYESKMKQVASD